MSERITACLKQEINSGRYMNLSVSEDRLEEERLAVLLFTPDMQDTIKHWHIALNEEKAKKLHAWLSEFLGQTS